MWKILAAAIASTPEPVPTLEHALEAPLCASIAERQETAAGGAVMAGAEGERASISMSRSLDPDFVAVMRAVHDEAAGAHRHQPAEAFGDPVLGGDILKLKIGGHVVARRLRRRGRGSSPGRAARGNAARRARTPSSVLERGAGGVVGVQCFAAI